MQKFVTDISEIPEEVEIEEIEKADRLYDE